MVQYTQSPNLSFIDTYSIPSERLHKNCLVTALSEKYRSIDNGLVISLQCHSIKVDEGKVGQNVISKA